jgi:hypothetical protein
MAIINAIFFHVQCYNSCCLPQILLHVALSGGIFQWRQNTGKIPTGVAYYPSEILKYCSFRWHTSAEKNTEKMVIPDGIQPPKNTEVRHIRWAYFRGKNHGNMRGY